MNMALLNRDRKCNVFTISEGKYNVMRNKALTEDIKSRCDSLSHIGMTDIKKNKEISYGRTLMDTTLLRIMPAKQEYIKVNHVDTILSSRYVIYIGYQMPICGLDLVDSYVPSVSFLYLNGRVLSFNGILLMINTYLPQSSRLDNGVSLSNLLFNLERVLLFEYLKKVDTIILLTVLDIYDVCNGKLPLIY